MFFKLFFINSKIIKINKKSYRDHFLGQPVNGIRENIELINVDQIKNFYRDNFVGPKAVVSVAGNIDHEQISNLAQKHFSSLSKNCPQVFNFFEMNLLIFFIF